MEYRKIVHIDNRARKEIDKSPKAVVDEIKSLLIVLSREGKLEEPDSKKISQVLFEIRVKFKGQWRVLYA
jgi:hypothetical protein